MSLLLLLGVLLPYITKVVGWGGVVIWGVDGVVGVAGEGMLIVVVVGCLLLLGVDVVVVKKKKEVTPFDR